MYETQLFKLKDKYQREALNQWLGIANGIGVLEMATATGKSRCLVLAVEWIFKTIQNPRVLIITPTEIIRDTVIPEEFKKWGCKKLLKHIEIQCIQTAYKRKNEHFDFCGADEFHNYTGEQYSLFFENKIDKILGLSAKIPDDPERLAVVNSIAPVCYRLDADRAVELGLISPYVEYNVSVKMSPEEWEVYNNIQGNYDKYEHYLGGSLSAYTNASVIIRTGGGVARSNLNLCDDFDSIVKEFGGSEKKALLVTGKAYWQAMMERKKFLYECQSKVEAVRTLIDSLELKNTVIFSQSVKVASAIAKDRADILPYHTKLSKTKDRDFNMNAFLDGRTKVKHLSTCRCTEEGMDLPKLPAIIIASRNSSPKSHIQKRGRCLRYEEGRISAVYNLYIPATQDWKWLMAAQATTDKKNIIWTSLTDITNDNNKSKSVSEQFFAP